MNKQTKGTLLGAAFIMATSAVGPGFLTQTAIFTDQLQASFGFVILLSTLLAVIVQLNIWRILCVSGLRGQDISNKVLPGLGYFISFIVVLGGLIFNIGNVGGAALGFNALLGIPETWGYLLSGAISITVFLMKDALKAMDNISKILGAITILVILIVIFIVQPPIGLAIKEAVIPSAKYNDLMLPVITLLGGTVGGYITFAGAHRLIDAGITTEKNLSSINKSSVMGIGIATIVRTFLFLAVLGVIVTGVVINKSNPAADVFKQGAGELGYRFFGLVLLSASITSIIGAAYTSVSFMKTLSTSISKHENKFIVLFIALSTIAMAFIGKPALLLVLAGALNGLILPITLGVCLIASQNTKIMGANYKHPKVLFFLGIIVVLIAAYMGIISMENLSNLF